MSGAVAVVATLSDRHWIARLAYTKVRLQKRFGRLNEIIDARDNQVLSTLITFVLRQSSNTVDVGAYKGSVLQQLVRSAPKGRHYAFEPVPALAQLLRESFPTVAVHEVALSDRSGETDFSVVRREPAFSGFRVLASRARGGDVQVVKVRTCRLDDVIPEDVKIDFIKIDVEGAVLQVLAGARRVITQSRPYVVFEFGGKWEGYGTTCEDVYDLIVRQYGLTLFGIDGSGPHDARSFFKRMAGDIWNFVAYPWADPR